MPGDAVLKGRRIDLRHPTRFDTRSFLEFVRENRRYHRPWVYPPADRSSFQQFVKRSDTDSHQGFLVVPTGGGEPIGVVDMTHIVRGVLQSAYLGFYGSARSAGRGYMTEAVTLLIRHAFRRLKLHRIEANIQPENGRSIALVERCGFRKEGLSRRYLKIGGRWRDHERWAILADERRTGA